MMNNIKFFGFAALIGFIILACEKECIPVDDIPTDCVSCEGLLGKWNWVKSVGGIGGWTTTPETEGYAEYLQLDEFNYTEFRDNTLKFTKQYDLEIRQDTIYETNKYLTLNGGDEYALKHISDTLILFELCLGDCYTYTYIKD